MVRYDRIGVGLSDQKRRSYSLKEAVSELATVIDATGFPQVHLMGISCGGPPSIDYSLKNPTSVGKMIFFGSYMDGPTVATQELQAALQELIRAHWGIGSRAMADLFAPNLSKEDIHLLGANQRHSCSAETAARLLGMGFTMSARDTAPKVTAPSLVMHRQGDKTVGFERGRDLAMEIPGSTFLPLEGASHVPWEGDADRVIEAVVDFLDCRREAPPSKNTHGSEAYLIRKGDLWELSFGGQSIHLKHSKGLMDLARLLTHPHREFPAIDLMAGPEKALPQPLAQNLIDEQARRNYHARLITLEETMTMAKKCQDLSRLDRIQEEKEFLLAELANSRGLGGRERNFALPQERARKAVSARLRSTLKKVGASHTELGEHLESTVSTGLTCSYRPLGEQTIEWIQR